MMRAATKNGVPAGRERGLVIGGLERFSVVDWPGQITATVFCQGCGWRCRYCHNPGLMAFRAPGAAREGEWTWPAVLAWLRDRRGLLDGVVFSGGEPTLQPGLADAVRATRELGFRVGLHTGGPAPEVLGEVLPLVDWVGFDFKAPFEEYIRVTGRAGGDAARLSLRMIRAAGVACEVRTTWHPDLLSAGDLAEMARSLSAAGIVEWVIQRFRPEGCADAGLRVLGPGELPECEGVEATALVVRVR
jgi:pyruvate formate lyase activating enzyme